MKKISKKKIWQTLSAKVVHKNPWYRIVQEKFVLPAQRVGSYFIIEPHGTGKSVMIVAAVDHRMLFVKQYRYVQKQWTLELPMGGVEKGEATRAAAQRELMQESGYKARNLKKHETFWPLSGPLYERCSIYLASNLIPTTTAKPDETEVGIHTVWIPVDKVYRMVDAGKITDGQTLATLALVRNRIISQK